MLDGDSELVPWLIERGARVDAYAAARHGIRASREQGTHHDGQHPGFWTD